MADYGCWPLWEPGSDPYPKEPEDLPLSEALRARLRAWADAFDAILNQDQTPLSDFPSEEARQQFCKEGDTLVELLRIELGSSFDVQ